MSNGTNAAIELAIKANADQLLAAIDKATLKVKELGDKIKSLPSGDKQFNKLSRELARTTITQQNLIKSYEKLGTESETTAPKLQKTADASRSARIAVSSLSIAIQDLPFGFIGIQNNLPAIIQGFGNLKTESKGLKDFFKSLGSQLVGPGGLFLAFSAGTAIITTLVQKYGSLGEAVDAILGQTNNYKNKINELNKSYEEFNKNAKTSNDIVIEETSSVQGQITKVQTLSKVILDSSTSYTNKEKALQQLKKISEQYFGGLELNTTTIKTLTELTNKYTQSLINQAIARGYEEEIVKTSKELATQQQALVDLSKQLPTEYKKIKDAAKEAFNVSDAEAYLLKISSVPEGVRSDIDKINVGFFKQADVVTELIKRLDTFKELFSTITIENLDFSVLDAENDKLKKNNKVAKEYLETYKQLLPFIKMRGAPDVIIPNVGGPMANNLRSPFLPDEEDIKLYEESLKSFESITQKYNDRIFNIFNRTLRQPIEDLFDTLLTTGKVAWADFGNAVVAVLKRVASQLIATGIASLIANILAPGAGLGVAAGLKGISTGALGDFLSIGDGADFRAVGPGGLAMTGAVSLSLRGSDLVGAINRTNTNINRIG
jgi:uncharacterized coiled-coil DUF342 family protein